MKIAQKTATLFATTLLIVFNLIDAFFSVKYIKFGPLCETNPVMDVLLEGNANIFLFYKIIVVSAFAFLLYQHRETKSVQIILYVLTFVYGLLMLWWSYMIFLVH